MVYRTKGTCASKIDLNIDKDHTIQSVLFTGGCNGNLQGISNSSSAVKPKKSSIHWKAPGAVSRIPPAPISLQKRSGRPLHNPSQSDRRRDPHGK